jgi:hypothetical protein
MTSSTTQKIAVATNSAEGPERQRARAKRMPVVASVSGRSHSIGASQLPQRFATNGPMSGRSASPRQGAAHCGQAGRLRTDRCAGIAAAA